MRRLFIFSIVLLFSVTMVFSAMAMEGLKYEGSSTLGEVIIPKLAKAFRADTGISFIHIGTRGSGNGFRALATGKAEIGGLSRSLSDAELASGLHNMNVGYDAIAIFINKNNPVTNLTKEQVKGIFTGKIKNWSEVGGHSAPIKVVTEVKSSNRATIKVFKKLALDGEAFGESKEIDKPHACVRFVTHDKNAITHASTNFLERGVKITAVNGVNPTQENILAGDYFLSRPLTLVAKKPFSNDDSKFMDFVASSKGKAIISTMFVPAK